MARMQCMAKAVAATQRRYHACLYFCNVCIYSVPGLTCNWRTVMAKAKKKAKKKAAKKK